jgi:hypothetical protein
VVESDHLVEWRLGDDGEICRDPGSALSSVMPAAEAAVSAHPAARENLESAIAFLTTALLNPKKAVTDAVSACESLGVELFPGTGDLRDLFRELRKRKLAQRYAAREEDAGNRRSPRR